MMPLNQYQRNAILYLLEQQETLAKPVSFTSVMKMGVSEKHIRIVDYLSQTLKSAPFLTLNELQFKGVSAKDIKATIGSLKGFKESLGLAEYTFTDWLTAQQPCYSSEQCIAMPYLIYQMFFDEIEAFHTDQHSLKPGMKVELAPGCHYSSVSLHGSENMLIPVDDGRALHLAASLLTELFSIKSIDEANSCLCIERIGSGDEHSVEVRCLSSCLSKSTFGGIYIHDDIGLSKTKCRSFALYPLAKLIDKHHRSQLQTQKSLVK